MNKKMKQIIACFLAVLMLCSTQAVSAETLRAGVSAAQELNTKKLLNKGIEDGKTVMAASDSTIDIGQLTYDTSKAKIQIAQTFGAGVKYTARFKATATGKMYMDYANTNEQPVWMYYNYKGGDYRNNASYGKSKYLYKKEESGRSYINVKKGQVLDLLFETPKYNKTSTTIGISAYILGNSNSSTKYAKKLPINAKGYMLGATYNNSDKLSTLYWKVTPDKTGVLNVYAKVYGSSYAGAYITVYNGKKQCVSDRKINMNNIKTSFGVSKGATYYLKIENVSSSSMAYGLKCTTSASKDANCSTKSKAITLKRKAAAKKVLFRATGKNETDYYKFTVPKKQATTVQLSSGKSCSGKLVIDLYKGKKKFHTTTVRAGRKVDIAIWTNLSAKASKGTYYAKVTKGKTFSGEYTIRYVK